MAVYDNKAADELARAKCWHRARGEWQHLPQAETSGERLFARETLKQLPPPSICLSPGGLDGTHSAQCFQLEHLPE